MEDGGRPSGGGLQDQPSNRPALRGDKIPGGERFGKRREETRQVCTRKANESEPRMFCRKTPNRHQNQADLAAWDQVQQEPVYGLDGDRQFSGASLAQAFMWNMGTWRSDAKGETQKGSPRKGQSTNAERRGGSARSSVEAR